MENRNRFRRTNVGMNRGQFLRTAGVGAAGLAGAAMFGSGMAHAGSTLSPYPKVVIFYAGAGNEYVEAVNHAKSVLNAAGITADAILTPTDDPLPRPPGKTGAEKVRDLLQQGGYTAILGVNTSDTGKRVADGLMLYGYPVQYIEAVATADDHNPLYPGSAYTMPPVYYHRTAVTSSQWGAALAREVMLTYNSNPLPANKAFIVRTIATTLDPNALDPFGSQGKYGFDVELGLNPTIGNPGTGSELIIINREGTQFLIDGTVYHHPLSIYTPTLLDSKLATNNWLIGSALATNPANAVNVATAFNALGNDNLTLAAIGTVDSGANGIKINPTAYQYMKDHGVAVIAYFPENTTGFDAWKNWFNQTQPISPRTIRAFDAAWLLAESIRFKMDADGIYQLITRFSGPMGKILYPYRNNISEVIRRSDVENINFEGASGPIDFINGEASVNYYMRWVPLPEEVILFG